MLEGAFFSPSFLPSKHSSEKILEANPDPLLVIVGNGALTFEENRSHFALWAAMKSPLLIGTSVIYH